MGLEEVKREEIQNFNSFYFIEITEKDISLIIKKLSEINEIPKHLKRIKKEERKIFCLICKVSEFEYKKFEFLENLKNLKKINLPEKIRNKEDFLKYKEIWPVNFFEKKEKEITFKEKYAEILKKEKEKISFCSNFCLIVDFRKDFYQKTQTKSKIFAEHAIFKGIENISKNEYDYLCTNLDAYLFGDPCKGCCMALLHSRISNVYILNSNFCEGFEKLFIHSQKFSNHKFRVFRIL